jgi:hypothetical protein
MSIRNTSDNDRREEVLVLEWSGLRGEMGTRHPPLGLGGMNVLLEGAS